MVNGSEEIKNNNKEYSNPDPNSPGPNGATLH